MKSGFLERLAAIPWADYQTAYGNAAGDHAFENLIARHIARAVTAARAYPGGGVGFSANDGSRST
jgi:hypothetical protein